MLEGTGIFETSKDSFSSFYNEELLPVIEELEVERLSIKQTLTYSAVVIGGLVALCAAVLPYLLIQSLLFGGVVGGSLWMWYKSKAARSYRAKFKYDVIGKIVRFIDKEYVYSAFGTISNTEFVNTGIFNTIPDRYHGEDLISGQKDQTKFMFSEVIAQKYVKDHRGRRSLQVFFKGLLFKADFNKHFNHRTVIKPDLGEKFLGSIGRSLQRLNFARSQSVTMEHVAFEKEFVVYSDSDQEARYLLSPSFMEKLLACKQRLDINISLSFYKAHIYVALPFAKDFFEPGIFNSIVDYDKTKTYYEDMELVLEIIDELNLNTRIWSKMPEIEDPEP